MAVLDLAQLASELQQYQHHTRSWASQQVSASQHMLRRNVADRLDFTSTRVRLTQDSQKLEEQQAECEARLQEQDEELVLLSSSITTAAAQKAALAAMLDDQGACLASSNQQLEEQYQGVQQQQTSQAATLQALDESLSKYRSHLGLRLQQSAERPGELQIVYSTLHPERPGDECTVRVSIDQDDQYQVTDSQPYLDGLSNEVTALNSSKDFSAFVRNLRRLFCQQAGA